MVNPVDPVCGHHTSLERKPAAVPELPSVHPHEILKQSHVEDHTEQIEATRRGFNRRSHDNLQQDLVDMKMANPVDPVLSHHTSQERQPVALSELPTETTLLMLQTILNLTT